VVGPESFLDASEFLGTDSLCSRMRGGRTNVAASGKQKNEKSADVDGQNRCLSELPMCLVPRTPAKLLTRQAAPRSRQYRQIAFRVEHRGCPLKHPKARHTFSLTTYCCYFLSPTFKVAVAVRVKLPPIPVTVIVHVPFDAPLGTTRSNVTLAVSLIEVSVTEFGTTVQVEPGGPPLQVRLITPWNPLFDDAVSVYAAM
jgi:hypothetical protein